MRISIPVIPPAKHAVSGGDWKKRTKGPLLIIPVIVLTIPEVPVY